MENRFGFKDFVVSVLLVFLIVSVWLAMKMFDRQHETLTLIAQQVNRQVRDQAQIRRELSELNLSIKSGVRVSGDPVVGEAAENSAQKDAFERIRAAQAMEGYAPGDWLIDAFGANVAKITPLVSVDAYGGAIQDHVLEGQATRDPNSLEWLPLLASNWEVTDNREAWQAYVDQRLAGPLTEEEIQDEAGIPGEDKPGERHAYIAKRLEEGRLREHIINEPACPPATIITFNLRPNVTFSDGEPLTSDDFLFTWELINNPELDAARVRFVYDRIKSVQAEGPHRVIFSFKEPYFESFGLAAGFTALPKHFYGKYTPTQINQTPGLLMGTGPYRMETPSGWTPGSQLRLVRNERYWGVMPAFDRLVYLEVNNDPARQTMFKNREIDVFGAQPDQYVQMIRDPDLLARTEHHEFESMASGYGFVAWNQKRRGTPTHFSDKRVRQAMTMMIDRQRIFDQVLLGYAIPVTGPFNRLSPQSDPSVEPWPFDVSRAKALLAEAGYADRDGDGVLDGPDGKPLRFQLLFPSGSGFWDRVMLMLKDNFARAGVIMELEPLEWSVFDERVKARDFDALCMAWSAGIETDIRQMFHSSQIADRADNFTSYSNPELDRLIETARQTIDETERMKLWNACHRILHEDQPYTFLYSRKSLRFVDGRVKNVERVKLGLNDRVEWFVPAPLQLRKQ